MFLPVIVIRLMLVSFFIFFSPIRECFKKAEALRVRQEELLVRRGKEDTSKSSDSRKTLGAGGSGLEEGDKEDSEESGSSDLDDLEMDWRAKHS